MQQTDITFTFTGAYADQHVLDGSDAVSYTEAARQLLALHAYFFVTGLVPKRGVQNETKHYRVFKRAPEAVGYTDPWVVNITGSMIGGVLAVYGVRAIDYGFAQLFKDSVGPIIQGKPSWMPPKMQGDELLRPHDTRNGSMFATEVERDFRWQQLRERATVILPQVARPVGRSARKLAITSGAIRIGAIDSDVQRRMAANAQAYNEAAIIDALHRLRLGRAI